jgi:hypothetical protein
VHNEGRFGVVGFGLVDSVTVGRYGRSVAPKAELRFDRRVGPELIDALTEGWLRPLLAYRNSAPLELDLQLRRSGGRQWVSLYLGLSAVLSVEVSKSAWRVRSHGTYRAAYGFDPAWGAWQPATQLEQHWAGIQGFVDDVWRDETIVGRYLRREGKVHPLMASGLHSDYRVIQREAVVSFPGAAARLGVIGEITARIHAAVAGTGRNEPWWPGVRDNGVMPPLGAKADLLAVDDAGRLLVIEAKPPDELKGIAWAPSQVALYAQLFRHLCSLVGAVEIIDEMLAQRVHLGLTAPGDGARIPVKVVPVVALGAGPRSPAALERLAAVAESLAMTGLDPVEPLEVWILDHRGGIEQRWLPSRETVPTEAAAAPKAAPHTFRSVARLAAAAWKAATDALSAPAKAPAPYRGQGAALPYCLPVAFAGENLLAEAREVGLSRFAAAGIPWHHGVGGGPSNHLLSSQVQCANALASRIQRPTELRQIFSAVLPMAEALPFGSEVTTEFDRTDYAVFEWTGLDDYLGEHPGRPGTRGANNTSADAAIRYRTPEGDTELALIEWKYTEEYIGHRLGGGLETNLVRQGRYRWIWDDPDGPLRTDLIPYEDLLVEPFYQLMRLQMLAWRMEGARELGAERVRVVIVAPSANHELFQSFNRPSQRDLGGGFGSHSLAPADTVYNAWRAMQRRPDRFALLDSALLVAAEAPTSAEFKSRYGHIGSPEPVVIRSDAPAPVERLRTAISLSQMILERISTPGGVISQVGELDDASIGRIDPLLLGQLTARLEELAELGRRVRAEEIFEALRQVPEPEDPAR